MINPIDFGITFSSLFAMLVSLLSSESLSSSRYNYQKKQLESLGLKYILYEPILPSNLSIPFSDSYWQRWQRPLRPVECAILQSHQNIWRSVQLSGAPSLVIEDDVCLSRQLPDFLELLSLSLSAELVVLETRGRKKLLSRRFHLSNTLRQLYQNKSGAAAYVLWPSGADKLLRMTANRGMLADAALCNLKGKRVFQAFPPLAFQADCCERYGFTSPILSTSSVLSIPKPSSSCYQAALRLRWLYNRILGQLSIARTFALHFLHSVYLEPLPLISDY